jgi:hypothetical protein
MIRILCSAVLILCVTTVYTGEAEPKLPAPAQTALERLAKADAKLVADYRKALAAERVKAIAELERIQKTVTKSGDLDGALAVKGKLDELRAAQDADASDLLAEKPVGPPTSNDPNKLVLGRWTFNKTNGTGGTVEFSPGGGTLVVVGQFTVPGRWRIEKDRVLIAWAGDETKWENMAFDGPDRLAGDSFDTGRNSVTCTRLKQPAK